MYLRTARKYGWETPSWALMENHHHFVVRLTKGGLSEGGMAGRRGRAR